MCYAYFARGLRRGKAPFAGIWLRQTPCLKRLPLLFAKIFSGKIFWRDFWIHCPPLRMTLGARARSTAFRSARRHRRHTRRSRSYDVFLAYRHSEGASPKNPLIRCLRGMITRIPPSKREPITPLNTCFKGGCRFTDRGDCAFCEGILTSATPCALLRQNTSASGYFSSHRPLRAAPSALLAATGGTRGAAEVMTCSLPTVILNEVKNPLIRCLRGMTKR